VGLIVPPTSSAGLLGVFLDGLRRSFQLRLLVPLYLSSLALGLVQTWPLFGNGAALRSPFLGRLATGGTDTLPDLFIGSPAAAGSAAAWSGTLLLLAVIYGLLYNFFGGGILSVWAGTRPFWPGCRRTFWTFTALGTLLLALACVLALTLALLGGFAGFRAQLIVLLVLLQVLNVLGEYARAIAAVHDRRNPFALLGASAGFCVRNAPGVLALALLGVLLHVALGASYLAVAGLLGASPLVVLWQQLAALLWVWIKLLRLGWAVSYVRTVDDERRTMSLEQPVPAAASMTNG